MKREIIFRGLTLDGEWKYGYYFRQGAFSFIQNDKGGNESILPETVGQFTGLLDCKGNRIFEGDIIAYYGSENGKEIGYSKDGRLVWKTPQGHFMINVIEINDPFQMEVIGNIHESLTPNTK